MGINCAQSRSSPFGLEGWDRDGASSLKKGLDRVPWWIEFACSVELKLEGVLLGSLQAASGLSSGHLGASRRKFMGILGHSGNVTVHGSQVGSGLGYLGKYGWSLQSS